MRRCPHCHDPHTKKDGRTASGQRYRCHACRRTFTDRTGTPFAGYRWERDIIALAVHWAALTPEVVRAYESSRARW